MNNVPPPEKWINNLDRMAASGKYDEVAIVFAYSWQTIYSWQTYKLKNLKHLMQEHSPIGFVAITRRNSRLDVRVWNAPWSSQEFPTLKVEEVLRADPNSEWLKHYKTYPDLED